jgi:hypothetical protein
MVMVERPVGVVAAVLIVTVVVPVPGRVMVAGLNEQLAPVGRPLQVGVIVPEYPLALKATAVSVVVALVPAITSCEVGFTLNAKSVTVIVATPAKPPVAVPVRLTSPSGAVPGAV